MNDKSIYRKNLMLTLQVIIASLIGIEVSFKPNPYIEELILMLTIYIVLKYNIIEKIQDTLDKILKNMGLNGID